MQDATTEYIYDAVMVHVESEKYDQLFSMC